MPGKLNVAVAVGVYALFVGIVLVSPAVSSENERGNPRTPRFHMSYFLSEKQTTELEEHRILIQFSIDVGRNVRYEYSDWVQGSKAPTAVSVRFESPYGKTVSEGELSALIDQLQAVKVYGLKSDPQPNGQPSYMENLDLTIGSRELRIDLYTPPQSSERIALKKVLLDFATRLGLDKPSAGVDVTIVSEGDFEPARPVFLQRLITKHEHYHGKRVAVVGFYDGKYPESRSLYVDDNAVANREVEKHVWVGEISSSVNPFLGKERPLSWMRVEGVFLWGHYGHKGGLQGMIDRVTKMEILDQQKP